MMSAMEAVRNEPVEKAGLLIGRADLSDDQMLDAVRMRLVASGQSAEAAASILDAARDGDEGSVALVNTVSVPAPVSKLSMPVQRLTAAKRSSISLAVSRLTSLGRG